jgi:hypothetical protein
MVHCVNRVIKVVFRPASEGFSLRRQGTCHMQHGGHGAQMTQRLGKNEGAEGWKDPLG